MFIQAVFNNKVANGITFAVVETHDPQIMYCWLIDFVDVTRAQEIVVSDDNFHLALQMCINKILIL